MKLSKIGQSATEFAIIFGAVLFFFAVFFAVINGSIADKNKEKERLIVNNVALDLREEIHIASESTSGYYREFTTPTNILGKDYSINVTNNQLIISTDYASSSYQIANFTGTIIKGNNYIRKENEDIYVNQ